ncbi:hypothetical protein GGR51DRAFT_256679 [Nemania sp. FL0031]|nr:hypothetical protein GGR51DRAFT_256679 [Nemania sp. FL0031]
MAASQILRSPGVHERSGNIRADNMLLFQNANCQVDRQSLISAFSSLMIGNRRSARIELRLIPSANVGRKDHQAPIRVAKTMDGALGPRRSDGDRAPVRRVVTDPSPFELPQLLRGDDGCLGDGRLPCEVGKCGGNAPGESAVRTRENPLNERPPLDGGNIDSDSLTDGLIPSQVEFMSNPAHEYWRWSQEKGNWWHIEEETGATVWAPLDFN